MEETLQKIQLTRGKSLPIIRQNEVAECGHACLAMVLSFFGHKIDLVTLRQRFPTSLNGIGLEYLIEIAHSFKMIARPLRVELSEINRVQCPAIIFWGLNHFVVLENASKQKVTLHDPAVGRRVMSLDEFSKDFTGIVLELRPDADFRPKTEVNSLKLNQLWTSITGLKRGIFQAVLLSLIMQVFILAAPFYLQLSVDRAIPSSDHKLLALLSMGFAGFLIIRASSEYLRGKTLLYLGSYFNFQTESNLFAHLVKLPLNYFERRHSGDVMSRFGSLKPIRNMITEGVVATVIDGVMAVTTLVAMFFYGTDLALIVLFSLFLYFTLRLITFKHYREQNEETIINQSIENSTLIETVRGIMCLKLFVKEDDRVARWQNDHANVINSEAQITQAKLRFSLGNTLILGLENIIIIYVSTLKVLDTEFTIGMIFAFLAYKQMFSDKVVSLIERLVEFRMLDLHLERLSDIALSKPETNPYEHSEKVSVNGGLIVRNASFQYAAGEPWIFQNTSFEIVAGESVAITGASGAGKTTLLKAMLGLLPLNSGGIIIDDVELTNRNVRSYRKQIATVMQDDTLFAGSIAENITFFDKKIDEDLLNQVAKLACIDKDINNMPMQFETMVGDMGSTLSGGQVQRVLIARALYRQPKILFIDEGTAHIDLETEVSISKALDSLKITRIFIAHRPETISNADRVFKIEEGTFQVS